MYERQWILNRFRKQTRAVVIRTLATGLIAIIAFFALVPLHESVHWITSEYFNPWLKPVSIHLYDKVCFENHSLGLVVLAERYPGALRDEPKDDANNNEVLAYGIQLMVSLLIAYVCYRQISKKEIFRGRLGRDGIYRMARQT